MVDPHAARTGGGDLLTIVGQVWYLSKGAYQARGADHAPAQEVRILGGFTTFSSLAHAALQLVDSGHASAGLWSVIFQVALGLGAVRIGQMGAQFVAST